MQILVLVENVTPRIEYIFKHILFEMLGLNVTFTTKINKFINYQGPAIAYTHSKVNQHISITPHGLLSRNDILKQSFAFISWRELPAFFQTNPNAEIPFDLFAASFYLITRYEEYLSGKRDLHDRFIHTNSLANKENFLHMPLVDLWVKELRLILKDKYSDIKLKENSFAFVPTIDVDNAYAFKHKGFVRSLLGTINSLVHFNFSQLLLRLAVLFSLKDDPFDCYERINDVLQNNPNAVWFFLGGKYGKYDKNLPVSKIAMQRLIKDISGKYSVGIHPSYGAGVNKERVSKELKELKIISGINIIRSRQHFLKIFMPQTFRILNEIGITQDFSMGYSSTIGFRASTCTPYNFYDLLDEKELPLKVIPFQVMDRALKQGLDLSPEAAVDKTIELAKMVRSIGGTFVLLWHNETLSEINEWKGWGDVLANIVKGIDSLD